MSIDFHVVIPVRFASTRLPGKPLMLIEGMTLLERVYRQVQLAHPASITIATDDVRIAAHAEGFGATVVWTAATHASGTSRIIEVLQKQARAPQDIIVNVQGDEPFMPPELIQQVACVLQESQAPMATLCAPILSQTDYENPNVVKVVRDVNNLALYFSRSPIPSVQQRTQTVQAYRHVGLYAYRAAFLSTLAALTPSVLEETERLEQLTVLWHGYDIVVAEALVAPGQDVNTEEDIASARQICQHDKSQ